jgi:3-oxoacyl-[acyl-carrier protein] reductase
VTGTGFADLTGLRAVVTGSSSGIGRAIAWEFARGGADVVVHCGRSVQEAESLAEEIRQLGRAVEVVPADLGNADELAGFVDRVWDRFGHVDVWVNNAGVDLLTGEAGRLEYSEKLERLFEIDVRGTVLLSRLVGRRMSEGAGGGILNIGWDRADRGMEGDSGELFASAKNAVMGFTRSLALSLAPKIRVNCIAPGWIQTAWGRQAGDAWQQRIRRETPLGRWGTPEDVAAVARFLASREAAFITGQIINVNGGAER